LLLACVKRAIRARNKDPASDHPQQGNKAASRKTSNAEGPSTAGRLIHTALASDHCDRASLALALECVWALSQSPPHLLPAPTNEGNARNALTCEPLSAIQLAMLPAVRESARLLLTLAHSDEVTSLHPQKPLQDHIEELPHLAGLSAALVGLSLSQQQCGQQHDSWQEAGLHLEPCAVRHFLQVGGCRQLLALHFLLALSLRPQQGDSAEDNALLHLLLRGGGWVLRSLWTTITGPLSLLTADERRARWMALSVVAELSAFSSVGGFLHQQAAVHSLLEIITRSGEGERDVSLIRLALKAIANTTLSHSGNKDHARTVLADTLKTLIIPNSNNDEKHQGTLLSELASSDSVINFYFNLLTS